MQAKLEERKTRLEEMKEKIESKLRTAKEKDDFRMEIARFKMEFLVNTFPEKTVLLEEKIEKYGAKLAARASLREAKAKRKIDIEECKLAELKDRLELDAERERQKQASRVKKIQNLAWITY